MMEIPLSGNTRTSSLVRILVFLHRQRKTGTLSLMTSSWTKKLFVHTGDVIFAASTYEDDRLGEMLLKAEKISVEQYDRSVEILQKSKKRQGAILVELGYLTPKELFWGVKFQVKEIIQSLFLAEDADYTFSDGELPAQEVITLRMSMGNLIYDSVKRIDNWTRIRREMPDTESALGLSSDPLNLFQDIELSAEDKTILSLIDGTKTIKEVLKASSLASFQALKILYVLWSLGIIEPAALPAAGGAKAARPQETDMKMTLSDILQPHAEEDDTLIQRINDMYAKINTLSPAELLEAGARPDSETISKNYYRLAKEFHPDRYFAIRDDSVKAKLTSIFDAITKAYNLLKSDASRTDRDRPAMAAAAKETALEENARAEDQFRQGIEEFKKGNYWGAAENFRWATKLSPASSIYWSYLSLSFSKMPGMLNDAEESLLAAIKLEPRNANFQANLGLIYLKSGMKKRAIGCFEKALRIDPANIKAVKGLQQAELAAGRDAIGGNTSGDHTGTN